ncbi:MAG: hypothetical protein RLY87_1413 [Chloroflexota bacterium]|jgi:glucosamine--fructose-6-phosphate aminotransferase (isomerizing)
MPEHGTHTWNELCSQPQAWSDALAVLATHMPTLTQHAAVQQATHIIWSGCGSPYYLAVAMGRLQQQRSDIPVSVIPASEIWNNPKASIPRTGTPTLILLSRSGSTTEVLKAAEQFRASAPQGRIITISCYGERPLATLGDINIVLPSGQEQSIAQTRAFSVLHVGALAVLWALTGGDFADFAPIPAVGAAVIAKYQAHCVAIGANPAYDQFFFLGSGYRYGLACEASLKMKEMSLTVSEPFHHMEFRHGPQSMVTPKTLVVGIGSLLTQAQEEAVLKDMRALGGHTLSIGPNATSDMQWDATLPEECNGLIALPLLQSIAYSRATSRGLDPDNPHNLNAVVVL